MEDVGYKSIEITKENGSWNKERSLSASKNGLKRLFKRSRKLDNTNKNIISCNLIASTLFILYPTKILLIYKLLIII